MTRTLRLFTALFTLSFILTVLPLPRAFAATSFEDLLGDSVDSPAFHYTFRGDLHFPVETSTETKIIDENCFRKYPTTPCLYETKVNSVQGTVGFAGEGGKQSGVYAESGNFQFRVSGFDQQPSPLPSGFSEMNVSTGYKSQYLEEGLTTLIELTSFQINMDASGVEKIMGMVNEFLKFYVGKVYKISMRDLGVTMEQFLKSLQASGMPATSDVAFSLIEKIVESKLSVREMYEALGQLVDGLIESGLLREVSGSTATNHILSLGTSITKEGAGVYKAAILDFLKTINPRINNAELQFIQKQSVANLFRSLNGDLKNAQNTKVLVTVREQDGKIQAIDYDLKNKDLSVIGNGTISLDYEQGYAVILKQDPADIIDLNTIIDGFLDVGKMFFPVAGTSRFIECDSAQCARDKFMK